MVKKWSLLFTAVCLLILAAVACEAEPQFVEVTRIVTETVTEEVVVEGEARVVEVEVTRVVVEAVEEDQTAGDQEQMADVYRIGMHAEPNSLNIWNTYGPANSAWNAAVMWDEAGYLYVLSDQRFDFVPLLAADLPSELQKEGEYWTVTVELAPDIVWSDGMPITAHDVVFTLNTCLDLELTQNWLDQCKPEILDRVEAIDDVTVKYYFRDLPGLAQWQYGVALSPILPQHYWGDTVAEALAMVEGLEEPQPPEDVADCTAEGLDADSAAVCEPYLAEKEAYDDAYTNARAFLYDADSTGVPVAGAFTMDQFEEGAFVMRSANSSYNLAGSEVVEHDDGTWTRIMPNGRTIQLYGDGSGQETLHYTEGPFVNNVVYSIYGDQSASFLALIDGDIDFVISLNPSRGLKDMAEKSPNVKYFTNPDNGLFYMAFNLRKKPFSDPAFREAVDYLIDKEFVVNNVLQGAAISSYSIVPQGNRFWYNDELQTPTVGLTRAERLTKAMEILEEAGYTWDEKPSWDPEDPDAQNLTKGSGLRQPDGSLIEPFVILGPGPAYDPVRATFNQWISQWMRQIGIPVESELTGFNTILGPVFGDGTFDMYILGWSLTIYPEYLCAFFDSREDLVVTGGFNTPGFNNPDFDEKCDEFYAETDINLAKEEADELQAVLAAERPYIPLFLTEAVDYVGENVEFPYTKTLGGIGFSGFQNNVQLTLAK